MGSLLGHTRRQRSFRAFLIVAAFCLFFLNSQRHALVSIDEAAWGNVPETLVQHDYSGNCNYLKIHDFRNIAVTLKTGTTEAYKNLPAQLRTGLSCIPDLIIVSDLSGTAYRHQVLDILDRVSPKIHKEDRALTLYTEQQRLRNLGSSLYDIGHELAADVTWRNAAWMMDRYKFTHMLNHTWTQLPERDWYVFMETDTYVFWPNLIRLLRTLDPTEPLYMGSKESMKDTAYVYGGSGIVISHAAMRRFINQYAQYTQMWDERTLHFCCGDYALGVFFSEIGINATDSTGIMSQQNIWTVPYGQNGLYCRDIVSLHHMAPSLVDTAWRIEQEAHSRGTGRISFSMLREVTFPKDRKQPARRVDWDNSCPAKGYEIAPGKAKTAIHSEEQCRQLCGSERGCLQYLFRQDEVCKLFSCYSIGKAVDSYKGKSWVSGWEHERFEAWEAANPCDKEG